MYVCICNGVTEKDIREAVDDGAVSVGCLKKRLGVSECCGQCKDRASDYIEALTVSSGFPPASELQYG